MIELGASQPWAAQQLSLQPGWLVLLLLLGASALLPRATPARYLSLLVLVLWLFPPQRSADSAALTLTVWDVGQGLAVLLDDGEHRLLYDVGPRSKNGFDAGASIVVPNLFARNITSLDQVVISHGDADHAGGLSALLAAMPVGELITGEVERLDVNHETVGCFAGQHWSWKTTAFEVLWPPEGEKLSPNNRSCVLKVTHGDFSVLFTGDIDIGVEARLVKTYGERLRADVLMVPHHGSRFGSSPGLLNWASPSLAIVSASHQSQFGHPAPDVVRRLEVREIPWLNTADYGAIELTLGSGSLTVGAERLRRWGYWVDRAGEDFRPDGRWRRLELIDVGTN
jgi:competence protein ComEC